MGKYLRLLVLIVGLGVIGGGVFGADTTITIGGATLSSDPMGVWDLNPGGVPANDNTVTSITHDNAANSTNEVVVLSTNTALNAINITDAGGAPSITSDNDAAAITVQGGAALGLTITLTGAAAGAGITADADNGRCIELQASSPVSTIRLNAAGAGNVTLNNNGGANAALDGSASTANMTVILDASSTGDDIITGDVSFGSGTNQLQLNSSNAGGDITITGNVVAGANTVEIVVNDTAGAAMTAGGVTLAGGAVNVTGTDGQWTFTNVTGDSGGAATNDTFSVNNTAAVGAVTLIGDVNLVDGNNTITINGGAANTLTMRADNIQTGSGNDTVTISGQTILTDGGAATCIINTGSGNDTITVNLDQNVATLNDATIRPGAGTNTVTFNISDNNDKLLNTLDLQDDGTNTISFTNSAGAARVFTISNLASGDGNDTFNLDALNAAYTDDLNLTITPVLALGGGANSIRIIADDDAATLTTTAAGITASDDSTNTITVSATDAANALLNSVGSDIDLGGGTGSNTILVNASNAGNATFTLAGNDFTADGSGTQSIQVWTSGTLGGVAAFNVQAATLGAGDDLVSVTASSSGGGSNASYTGTGNLNLAAGNDTVTVDSSGGAGTALLTVGANNIEFGAGNDTINLTAGAANATITGTVNLGADNDTVTMGGSGAGVAVVSNVINAGAGDDSITATGQSDFDGDIHLDAGNDTLTVTSAEDGVDGVQIFSGSGNDTISITNNSAANPWTITAIDLNTGAVAGDANTLTLNGSTSTLTVTSLILDATNTGDTNISVIGDTILTDATSGAANTVDLGDGTNTFDFASTAAAAFGNALTIQGGTGTDTVNITNNSGGNWTTTAVNGDAGDDTISLAVANAGNLTVTTVNGGTGNNTLNLNNTGTGVLTVTNLTAAGNLRLNANGDATITNAVDLSAAGIDMIDVQSGTLTFGAGLTLGAGDTLQGVGSITGNVAVGGAGCTTSPGDSSTIGTLAITGNYTHNAGADFNINYDASSNDVLTVTGTATINGGTVTPAILGSSTLIQDNTSYTFLRAGTLTVNTPLTMNTPSSPFLSFDLSFTATEYMWTANRVAYTTVYTNLNSNQTAIAATLQTVLLTAPTGDMETVLLEIDKLDTLEKFKDAMNDISPEPYTAVVNTVDHSLLTVFTGEVSSHLASMRAGGTSFAFVENDPDRKQPKGPSGPSAQTEAETQSETQAEKKHLRTWAKAYGSWSDVSKVSDRFGYDVDTSGGIVGGDSRFGLFTLGLCLGYDETHIDWEPTSAVGDVDALHVGTYGSFSIGRFYTDASIIYSSNSHNVTRNISFAGINRSANSDYDSDSYSFYLGAGYDLQFKNWTLSPMASIQYTIVDMDDMIEDGASSLNLLVKGDNVNSFKTNLGFKLGYLFKVAHAIVHPTINAAWIREYGDNNQSLTASFEGAPGYTFQVDPRYIGDDTYKFGLGVEVRLDNNVTLNFNYNYELTDCKEYDDIDSHLINGGIAILF